MFIASASKVYGIVYGDLGRLLIRQFFLVENFLSPHGLFIAGVIYMDQAVACESLNWVESKVWAYP